jgi:hypothetical protein
MNRPAEAARLPDGATYTTTGTALSRIFFVTSLVESASPPGVSSTMMTHSAWRCSARSMVRTRKRAVIGLMMSLSSVATSTSRRLTVAP